MVVSVASKGFFMTKNAKAGAGEQKSRDPTANITKINKVRASIQVMQQIEEAILQGTLAVGGRLPSERELQVKLEVSRNTLRESLRVLEQKGLVEIRKGRLGGIYIKEVNAGPMTESLSLFVQSHRITMDDISGFRQDLEGLVARRAAAKADLKMVQVLDRLLQKAGTLAEQGPISWSEFMEADKEIHLAIAAMGGNPLHHYFLQTVHDNLHHYSITAYLPRDKKMIDTTLEELKGIIDAISRHDEKSAETLAREHVARATRIMSGQ